ncbi:MAG: hypothetical protein LBB81_07660 [Treponema sp.]|nr:hypothetical protein [Treponema sp.]
MKTASEKTASGDVVSIIQAEAYLPTIESSAKSFAEAAETRRLLDELAELERSGSWFHGMAITESGLHEALGNYPESVAAAYKELSYGYGRGLLNKNELEQGLLNLLGLKNGNVNAAVEAILAFIHGQWGEAAANLSGQFNELEEPDGFGQWMILACALEKDFIERSRNELEAKKTSFGTAAMYKAIRARYVNFPEYWYHGARVFSGLIAAEYAENCINTAPDGPFAAECRKIIAAQSGISPEDALSIKTKQEVDALISQSVKNSNPEMLESLLPLIALSENPYTVYAVNMLRSLSVTQKYNDYLSVQIASSKGRLKERLSYICRG